MRWGGRRSRRGGGALAAIALPDSAGVRALGGHEGRRCLTLPGRDLGHGPFRRDGPVVVGRSRGVAVYRALVAVLDQEPGVLRLAGRVALQAHDHPGPVHPLAFHDELQLALGEGLADVLEALLRRPVAAVPQHHRAATVLALGDRAFEVAVVERVILDLDRQPTIVWV